MKHVIISPQLSNTLFYLNFQFINLLIIWAHYIGFFFPSAIKFKLSNAFIYLCNYSPLESALLRVQIWILKFSIIFIFSVSL